jgi:hypothetical protein
LQRFESARLVVEVSQIKIREADEPNAFFDLFDAPPAAVLSGKNGLLK